MFALALWDRRDQRLHLARDRFGEKPLYWGLSGTGPERALLFGSELAALRAWQGFNNAIHRPALAQLLRFGAIAAPTSIYTGIQQLLPGHLVSIQAPFTVEQPQPRALSCFSSIVAVIETAFNRDLANAPYTGKQPALAASAITPTRQLTETYDDWSPETLAARQAQIVRRAPAIWRITQLS